MEPDCTPTRKPPWLRVRLPAGDRCRSTRGAVNGARLHTVCEEARCPNQAECWGSGTATFLILGDLCTRGCGFCAVRRAPAPPPPGAEEGQRVARAAQGLGLRYVVVTSVTRDDLPDGGAAVFADTVHALRGLPAQPLVELLIPDYRGAALERILAAPPDVLAHNLEVVERLTPRVRHPRFDYRRSLEVLGEAKRSRPELLTKSSLMLGLGETEAEVLAAMQDLRAVGTDLLALGQYLQPTPERLPVERYVAPATFRRLAVRGRALGFAHVAAGPLVRTSYQAAEAYVRGARAASNRPAAPR